MFLFIFENFGTQELLLVGVVALILLGPRKMPEIARKIGKMMAEFRGTANEFKETWQREVNFEEEVKALDLKALDAETVKRVESVEVQTVERPVEPLIQPIDPSAFGPLEKGPKPAREPITERRDQPKLPLAAADQNDKKNWL